MTETRQVEIAAGVGLTSAEHLALRHAVTDAMIGVVTEITIDGQPAARIVPASREATAVTELADPYLEDPPRPPAAYPYGAPWGPDNPAPDSAWGRAQAARITARQAAVWAAWHALADDDPHPIATVATVTGLPFATVHAIIGGEGPALEEAVTELDDPYGTDAAQAAGWDEVARAEQERGGGVS
jgi:antitoxin (DNA-binding transcriptional repressor) of toxin-antitoxin stability system